MNNSNSICEKLCAFLYLKVIDLNGNEIFMHHHLSKTADFFYDTFISSALNTLKEDCAFEIGSNRANKWIYSSKFELIKDNILQIKIENTLFKIKSIEGQSVFTVINDVDVESVLSLLVKNDTLDYEGCWVDNVAILISDMLDYRSDESFNIYEEVQKCEFVNYDDDDQDACPLFNNNLLNLNVKLIDESPKFEDYDYSGVFEIYDSNNLPVCYIEISYIYTSQGINGQTVKVKEVVPQQRMTTVYVDKY